MTNDETVSENNMQDCRADVEPKADGAPFDASLVAELDAFVEENWQDAVESIRRLVSIPSTEALGEAGVRAPFGPGPRRALDEALAIASEMGFSVFDVDGYVGCADMLASQGDDPTDEPAREQLGIIGHVDVVPAGPGWTFEPYAVTVKDGFLIGRGVIDDKGPVLMALYALKFWKDHGAHFDKNVRVIFGCNEETGMNDVPYYLQKFPAPDFLFTPDAEFPVCYGEKGRYAASIVSSNIEGGHLVSLEAGTVANALPGLAYAEVSVDSPESFQRLVEAAQDAPEALGLASGDAAVFVAETVLDAPGEREFPLVATVRANGKSAHASTPEKGISALALLAQTLIASKACTPAEELFLGFVANLVAATDGSTWGLACSDDHFGPLTLVGGTLNLREGRLVQTIDCRYPSCMASQEIAQAASSRASQVGATVQDESVQVPFLMDPDDPAVACLIDTYNAVTGEQAKPFTIGGGTYARHFPHAVSFGLEKPWEAYPSWVGGMHGPDEGVSIEQMKQAMKIYALAIGRLMEVPL